MNYIEDDLKLITCPCCDREDEEEIENEYIQEFINEYGCPNGCHNRPIINNYYDLDEEYCETCQGIRQKYEHACFIEKLKEQLKNKLRDDNDLGDNELISCD